MNELQVIFISTAVTTCSSKRKAREQDVISRFGTRKTVDSDAFDWQDSSDSDSGSDKIFAASHHGVPKSAPDEEVDAYDGDASATGSEADITAIEL